MAVRVLLADDHTMLREGLRRSLELHGFVVVGEAADGEEALRMAGELEPDVILMDVSMPVLDGIEATRQIRSGGDAPSVVILTMHADRSVVDRALKAGAAGYLVKDCSTEEIADLLRQAAGDGTAVSPTVAGAILDDEPAPSLLSAREIEVLQRIADGASTTEAAAQLYVSAKTIKNHLASIYAKLDAHDRTQAVLQAARLGIIRLS